MTNRILLGAMPDGKYGVRVSKAGQDVAQNPVDNGNMSFNSDWAGTFQIYLEGQFSYTQDGSSHDITVNFPSLGYVPLILFYDANHAIVDIDFGSTIGIGNMYGPSAASYVIHDGYFVWSYFSGTTSFLIKYKILTDRAA